MQLHGHPSSSEFLAMTRPYAHAWRSFPQGNDTTETLYAVRERGVSGVTWAAAVTSHGNSYTPSQDFDALRRRHNEAFCNGDMMREAVEARAVDFIRWHLQHCRKNEASWLLPLAAVHGALNVLTYFHNKHVDEQIVQRAIMEAVTKGPHTVIRWMHSNMPRVDWTTDAMDQAAKRGRLDVVKWLHTNRPEGCTEKAMDGAVEEGHYYVVKWLCENRTESCSSSALVRAMKNGWRDIVALLLEVNALRNWPEPHHAKELTKLIQVCEFTVFQDIVKHRKQLYEPTRAGNPTENAEDDAPNTKIKMSEYVLTGISKVCNIPHGDVPIDGRDDRNSFLPAEIGQLISSFVVKREYATAVEDGNVHWLTHFSKHPNKDALQLAERGNLEEARRLHHNLLADKRLRCRKKFIYITMETTNFDFIKWHVGGCPDHSMEEWLYAATHVGREDVVAWMKQSWCTLEKIPRNPGGVLLFPNSLQGSLAWVEQEFSNVLPLVKKQWTGLEQAAWSGKLMDVRTYYSEKSKVTSPNAADLAAIKGKFQALEYLLDKGFTCSVGGLFGAIKGGHVAVVQHLYKHQPELAVWPKKEDGHALLRRFLKPVQNEMLKFFVRTRRMKLEMHDLSQAAFRGDREQVQVLCDRELQLVECRLDADIAARLDAVDIAAVLGDDEMLKILYPPDQECSARAMCGAAEEGHLAMVQHLHTRNTTISRPAVDLAARNGHVEIVRYLLRHRLACSDWAMFWASACGHADVVLTLVEHLVKCDVDKCVEAAMTEEIAAILRENRKKIEQTQRSSKYKARKTRSTMAKMVRKPSRVIYHELESRIWPNGLPSDLKSGVPPGN